MKPDKSGISVGAGENRMAVDREEGITGQENEVLEIQGDDHPILFNVSQEIPHDRIYRSG